MRRASSRPSLGSGALDLDAGGQRCHLLLQVRAHVTRTVPSSGAEKGLVTCGGAKGTRTPNPLLAKGIRAAKSGVGEHGPRPPESGIVGADDRL